MSEKAIACGCTNSNVGRSVIVLGHEHWGTINVVEDLQFVGADGRHWLRLQRQDWMFYVECREVKDT